MPNFTLNVTYSVSTALCAGSTLSSKFVGAAFPYCCKKPTFVQSAALGNLGLGAAIHALRSNDCFSLILRGSARSMDQFLQCPVSADKFIDRLAHFLGFSRPFPILPRRMAWPSSVPTSSPMHATNAPALNGGCATPLASGLRGCCAPGRTIEPFGRVHEVIVIFCHPTAPRFGHCPR